MEVHHHSSVSGSHTGRKKFQHYLFEFFMLFLAVFCGFLAENFREHQIENKKARQYIISLISDLKDDTSSINIQVAEMKEKALLFDSLSIFMDSPALAKKNGEAVYYTSRMGIRQAPLINNTRTFDQLTYSGGFRLIREPETSNRIMKYYSLFPELRMMEGFYNSENMAFKDVASMVMDQAVYRKQENPDGSINRVGGNPALLTYDPILLKRLGFYAVEMNGSRRGMMPYLKKIKDAAIELLEYLKKTYQPK
ncbi:MAG: hypothetical protein JST10_04885 [Bacteroidetes bacterium]|nr:hypothetical protein [Bacteroidota bacterium]MBS1631889.1 hypothetical protein [Bacteroidota bacterium]